jgi:hypothetical protein
LNIRLLGGTIAPVAVHDEPATRFTRRRPPTPEPQLQPAGQPRPPKRIERPLKLRIKHRAVPHLVVELECMALIGRDLPVVTRSGWLPDDDELCDLTAERETHARLVAEVERRERYLNETLKPEIVRERRARVEAMAKGEDKGRPMPNGDKLIRDCEDRILAAQVQLVAWCDETLGRIRALAHGELGNRLRHRDEQAAQELRRAQERLKAAEAAATRTYAFGQWLRAANGERGQVAAWTQAKNAKPPGPTRSVYDRPTTPTRA